jgi:hypothetical protein
VVVAAEYFTKWIEAKLLVNIEAAGLRRFFLVEHNMPFWSTQRDNSRQHQAIRLPLIHGLLLPVGGRSSLHIHVSCLVQRSSVKSECIDIHSYKEDNRGPAKRQMGRRAAESCMQSHTSVCRVMKYTPFKLLYGEEPVTPEEIKLCSAKTRTKVNYSPAKPKRKICWNRSA